MDPQSHEGGVRTGHVGTQGEGGHLKPRRAAAEETKPADPLTLDCSLQSGENINFCCGSPCGLRHFGWAALANECTCPKGMTWI